MPPDSISEQVIQLHDRFGLIGTDPQKFRNNHLILRTIRRLTQMEQPIILGAADQFGFVRQRVAKGR